ncbi:MAG TPA: DUF1611 domain-containing protein [bacterium]|nr:DUF1611 domain-containing protein [bacterium]
MVYHPGKKLVILAEGCFGKKGSKTAIGVIRYGANPVAAVLDSSHAGQTVADVLGIRPDIPIVSSLDEVESLLGTTADALVIGIAPRGGSLPAAWKDIIKDALDRGMDVWNGLHLMMTEDPELMEHAQRSGAVVWDVRKPQPNLPVSSGHARHVPAHVILAVGSDCSVGKMTDMLEVEKVATQRGIRALFCPTGQTGIMIKGWGVPIDRVISDFVAGGAEKLVLEAAEDNDLILVEGQGSLFHAGYSGVTLGLMHGTMPDHLVLCYQVGRPTVGDGYGVNTPSLKEMIRVYETMAAAVKPSPVIAIVVNTWGMSDEEARAELKRAEAETGLPSDDVVRYGADRILDAILEAGKTLSKPART